MKSYYLPIFLGLLMYVLQQSALNAENAISSYEPRLLKISVYRNSSYDEHLLQDSQSQIDEKLNRVDQFSKVFDLHAYIISSNTFFIKINNPKEGIKYAFASVSKEDGFLFMEDGLKKMEPRKAVNKLKAKLNYDFTTLQAAGIELYSEKTILAGKLIDSIRDSRFDSLFYSKKTISKSTSQGCIITQFKHFGQDSNEYIVEDYVLTRNNADYPSMNPDQRAQILAKFKANSSYKLLIDMVSDYRSKKSPFGYESQIEVVELVEGVVPPTLEDFLNSKD